VFVSIITAMHCHVSTSDLFRWSYTEPDSRVTGGARVLVVTKNANSRPTITVARCIEPFLVTVAL